MVVSRAFLQWSPHFSGRISPPLNPFWGSGVYLIPRSHCGDIPRFRVWRAARAFRAQSGIWPSDLRFYVDHPYRCRSRPSFCLPPRSCSRISRVSVRPPLASLVFTDFSEPISCHFDRCCRSTVSLPPFNHTVNTKSRPFYRRIPRVFWSCILPS